MQPFFLLLFAATTIWVAVDARGRDWSDHGFANATWKWVVGLLFLWIIAFPTYLVHRNRVPAKP